MGRARRGAEPMAEPIRVLLIDDEADFLEAVGFWLSSKGYQVAQARGGAQAVALLKQTPQDVVFLDVVMPDIDGIETLRRIRAFNKTIPVVLVTTSVADESKYAGAKALGISGLFLKGSSLDQLGQVLEVAIRMVRRSRANLGKGSGSPPRDGGLLAILRSVRERFFPPRRSPSQTPH